MKMNFVIKRIPLESGGPNSSMKFSEGPKDIGKSTIASDFGSLVSRQSCGHMANPLIIGKTRYKCCTGSAKTCKLKVIKTLHKQLKISQFTKQRAEESLKELQEENKNMKNELIELKKLLTISQAETEILRKTPQVINNIVTTNTQNISMVGKGCVVKSKAYDILQDALSGINIYESAYKNILSMPPSESRDSMLTLATSKNPKDVLIFKRSVVQNVDSGIEKISDPSVKTFVIANLQKINKEIDMDAQKMGIEIE
jgi:hypothetical protein